MVVYKPHAGCMCLSSTLVEDFIEKNKANNTVKKTKSDLNVWYRWCAGVRPYQINYLFIIPSLSTEFLEKIIYFLRMREVCAN